MSLYLKLHRHNYCLLKTDHTWAFQFNCSDIFYYFLRQFISLIQKIKTVSSRMGIIAGLKFAHLTLVPVFKNYVILFYHWSVYHSRPQKLFLQLLALESKWLENPLALQQNLIALHFCMIMSSPNWQIMEKCGVVCILYLVVTFMLFWH